MSSRPHHAATALVGLPLLAAAASAQSVNLHIEPDRPDKRTHLETRLYEASSGRLVFRATSATGNPVSPGSVALAVIDAMIGELSERRILAARLP